MSDDPTKTKPELSSKASTPKPLLQRLKGVLKLNFLNLIPFLHLNLFSLKPELNLNLQHSFS
jgi:hypothetical protein